MSGIEHVIASVKQELKKRDRIDVLSIASEVKRLGRFKLYAKFAIASTLGVAVLIVYTKPKFLCTNVKSDPDDKYRPPELIPAKLATASLVLGLTGTVGFFLAAGGQL